MTVLLIILGIAGSLGLFLYGLRLTSDSIQKAAGEKLHKALELMTRNRFAAFLTGIGITGLVQSSSATTVMTVSFVNAGLLKLSRAIGVIIGANIGTTLTAWIIAFFGFKFSIASIAVPLAGFGIILFFSKREKNKYYGEFLLGFSILLLGLNYLKDSVPDIGSHPEILEFISNFTGKGFLSFIIFIAIGTVLTIILQSSSATMAITQTMVFAGWIDFPTACAIVLGENIGTTITAQLASLGTNINARRTAMAHTFFNIVGAIWMSFIFTHFLKFVLFIMPLDPSNNASLTASLALFHTMFNLINAIVFLAFLPQFASFIEKIIKPKKVEDEELYQLKYLNYYMDAPEIQIYNAKREVTRMADLIMIMFKKFRHLFNTPKEKIDKDLKEINKLEQACDNMQFEISKFLSQCPRENLKTSSINNIAILIKIADELESISDSSQNLVYLLSRSHEKKMKWPQEIIDEINPYINLVYEFLEFISVRMNEKMDDEDFKTAYEIENRIDEFRNMLKKKARKRIEKGSEVKFEILVIDILQHIEHVGDYAMNVARALLEYNG